jgi:arylsulfatase A-like enzyme
LAVDLPADLGSQELVLKVARVGSGSQDLQVLLRDIHRQFLDLQDRVRVPQQLLSTTAEVQFLPAAPRSVRRLDSAGGRVLEADVLLLGGEVSVKSSSPQPFRVRVDGQVVATAGAAHQAVWKVAEPRLSRLQIEAGFGDLHGSFWLLQPAALQYRGPSELRSGEGKPWRAAEVQSISIEESTRSSLLLPAGAEVRLPARFREGDRLELAAAAIDGGGASLGGNQIAFEILWQPAAGTLQKIGQARLELGKAWKELRLAVPSACLGEGELLLKARSLAADRAFHLLLLAVAEPRIVAPRPAEAPPNLLIYLIDTLRADHLGCYGYPRPTSPAIDELAADGALFERAYAQASWTKPSVASLFCGLLASFHGVDKETALANELTTLAERLRSTGYHTAAYVANPYVHLRGLQFEQGFSNFVAVSAGARSPRADDVHRRALPWLEQNGDRPFFLYLHTIDPHETYDPPEETRGTFQRPYEGDLQPQGTYARMLRKRRECNDADLQFLLDLYDEEILFSDREFGRLVEFLRQQGLYDNTVIVLLSDHGEEFLEHGGFGHGGRLWNELLHVPLIIKPAGQTLPRGSRIAANVPLTSVLPSLPGLLGRGLGLPPLQGVDLLPWWRGERSESIDVIAEHGQELRCLIRGSQKVLERGTFGAKDSEVLWFDLLQDPGEQADLFALQPAVGRALQAALYESLENDRQRGVPRAQSEAVDLSKEQEDALRALGYLEQ